MADREDNIAGLMKDYLEFEASVRGPEVVLPEISPESQPVEITSNNRRSDSGGLDAIRLEMGDCVRCKLHEGRSNIVFGEGNPNARLMFIGEGPGAEEDKLGRPFVGRAGKLLDKMMAAMTLDRSKVYIANIVKCRPPGNRDPQPDEIGECSRFLEAQIETIAPEAIVALGRICACALLDTKKPLGQLRGQFHYRREIPVMPTYHPSFLLRSQGDRKWKANAWSDLKQVMAILNIPIPRIGE